jgi:hypothetical protein
MGGIVSGFTDALGLTDVGGTKYQARLAADRTRAASQLGAQLQPLKVFGMTNRLGSVTPSYEQMGGVDVLSGLDYSIAPELSNLQQGLLGYLPDALRLSAMARQESEPLAVGAASLGDLAQGYVAESPEAARQRYIDQQTALLDPIRAREEQRLGASVFGRGRAGLSVGDIGNPDLFALASARRQQDLALGAQAEEAAQRQAAFGAGLFGNMGDLLAQRYGLQASSFAPTQTALGLLGATEQIGQLPLETQLRIAQAIQPGTAAAGSLLAGGQTAAAQMQQQGYQAANQQVSNLISALVGGGVQAYGMSRMGTGSLYG